jgi:hypothetical protein
MINKNQQHDQSKIKRRLIIEGKKTTYFFKFPFSLNKQFHRNECITFFRQLLDSFSKVDTQNNQICTCQQYNRNNNAFDSENDGQQQQQQLYPHMRKVYNDETDLLEHVHIIMSTIKPECSMDEQQEETVAERRRRRARISKQRAKVLITEYCTRKITDNIKVQTNKRNYSSLLFLFYSMRVAIFEYIYIRMIQL